MKEIWYLDYEIETLAFTLIVVALSEAHTIIKSAVHMISIFINFISNKNSFISLLLDKILKKTKD